MSFCRPRVYTPVRGESVRSVGYDLACLQPWVPSFIALFDLGGDVGLHHLLILDAVGEGVPAEAQGKRVKVNFKINIRVVVQSSRANAMVTRPWR